MSEGVGLHAVVLRTSPLGEADLLATLLTAESGKIRAAAASARRSRRRFPGGLPSGAVGVARVIARPRGLARLVGFHPTREHAALGRDLETFACRGYLCELVDELVPDEAPDPATFFLLDQSLAALSERAPRHAAVLRRFELGLLEHLGWLPALSDCCVCGRPVGAAGGPAGDENDGVAFDLDRGGALCEAHGATAQRIPAQVLAVADRLRPPAPDPSAELSAASPATRRALRDLLRRVLASHLRRPLRSLEFFAELSRVGPPRA